MALARQHGIYAVAHPLRLDYVGLKKRLVGSSYCNEGGQGVQLEDGVRGVTRATRGVDRGGMIEFESARGDKMRIPRRATENRDWTKLLRAWRETEGDSDLGPDAGAGRNRAG